MTIRALDSRAALPVVDLHHNIARIFPRLGETGTTRDVLALVNMG